MRITPHDIRQQQFTVRMFRGFDADNIGRVKRIDCLESFALVA